METLILNYFIYPYDCDSDLRDLLPSLIKELKSNLFKVETILEKRKIIKNYIIAFEHAPDEVIDYRILLLKKRFNNEQELKTFIEKEGIKGLSEQELSAYNKYRLWNDIINTIQKLCMNCSIDFLEICKELGFRYEDFDLKNTEGQKENSISTEEEQIKEDIMNGLDKLNPGRTWKYAFRSEIDHCEFATILTHFFVTKDYTHHDIINLQDSCKTSLCGIFRDFHKEYRSKYNGPAKLKNDTEFFNILRILDCFEKLTDDEIYKALTK